MSEELKPNTEQPSTPETFFREEQERLDELAPKIEAETDPAAKEHMRKMLELSKISSLIALNSLKLK